MDLLTMAVRITEENYSIAVACLPPVVSTIPIKDVLGTYLVINELSVKFSKKNRKQRLEVGNSWMPKWLFDENYTFVTQELENRFSVVTKIA